MCVCVCVKGLSYLTDWADYIWSWYADVAPCICSYCKSCTCCTIIAVVDVDADAYADVDVDVDIDADGSAALAIF